MVAIEQSEYWKEGEKRIKLGEIENEILNLSKETSVDEGGGIALSTEEKAYRNDLVSKRKKESEFHFFYYNSPIFYSYLIITVFISGIHYSRFWI